MIKEKLGFTLVELVIVIVLLGILAATALPRFINISEDAHMGKLKGVMAALRSGINLSQSKWQLAGKPGVVDASGDGISDLIFNTDGIIVGAKNDDPAVAGEDFETDESVKRCLNFLTTLVPDALASPSSGNCVTDLNSGSVTADFCVANNIGLNVCEFYYKELFNSSTNYVNLMYSYGSGTLGPINAIAGEVWILKRDDADFGWAKE